MHKPRPVSREPPNLRHNRPQPTPSLASLMTYYSPDDSYNIKLNMNHMGTHLIETKVHQLSAKSKDVSIKCNKNKQQNTHTGFDSSGNTYERSRPSSTYRNTNLNLIKTTPKRERPTSRGGGFYPESHYQVSSPKGFPNGNTLKGEHGLFREAIDKDSNENSLGSEYFELVQKKAQEIKEEKKRMLQRCHSNGTLTNAMQNIRAHLHSEIDEYARQVIKNNKRGYPPTEASENVRLEVNELTIQNNRNAFGNQFSFQMDNTPLMPPTNQKQNHDMGKENQPINVAFDNGNNVLTPSSKAPSTREPARPSVQSMFPKTQKSPQHQANLRRLPEPLVQPYLSPKGIRSVASPAKFIHPQTSTISHQVQTKPMNTTTKTNQPQQRWIKVERPSNISYLNEIIDTIGNPHTTEGPDSYRIYVNCPFETPIK